jgi:predicted RNA-binding protein with PIN domain
MKTYLIDGNNLIGKIPKLFSLQKKDGQSSREQLAFTLERYFSKKKAKFIIHFDGYKNLPIKLSSGKIIYSDNCTADENIKIQIEQAKNRKNISVISSDFSIAQYAKKCSCEVISSEDFAAQMLSEKDNNVEESIVDSLKKENEEFKKLFGADED